MPERELHEKIKQLCEEANVEFIFATPGLIGWNITESEYLKELVDHIKGKGVEDVE